VARVDDLYAVASLLVTSRAMALNHTSAVGEGMAGIFPGEHATEADQLRMHACTFEAGGRTVVLCCAKRP